MPVTYRTDGERAVFPSIMRGFKRRCPACGEGRAFAGYLKLAERCSVCDTALGQIRADDFPPYLTIFAVGHLIVPLVLWSEQTVVPPMWVQMTVWPLLTLILSLLLLPLMKGAVVGLMWALRLRGSETQGITDNQPLSG